MARLVAATLLLVLAWGSFCTRGEDWSVEVLNVTDITLKDLSKDSRARLQAYVNLTQEDHSLAIRVASCPDWQCPEQTIKPVEKCLMPLRGLKGCRHPHCQVWYEYPTRCRCADSVGHSVGHSVGQIIWRFGHQKDINCSDADNPEAHSGGKRQKSHKEEPEMVKMHIHKESERVYNLTFRVCRERCDKGQKLRRVGRADSGHWVVGGVTVSWQDDEECRFKDCENGPCDCDGDSDFDANLRDFNVTVNTCDGETHTVPLTDLTTVLPKALNRCPEPTTTTTTTTTTTPITTTAPTTKPTGHNMPVVLSGETALLSSRNSTSASHVAWPAAGSVGVVLVVVGVALVIWVVRKRQRRHRDAEDTIQMRELSPISTEDSSQMHERSPISGTSSKDVSLEDATLLS